MNNFIVPRGTTDILPEEMHSWRALEERARGLFKLYDYQEIATPAFEERELFARSIGQSSDIVEKQMLNLSAQKQDGQNGSESSNLSLRPEGTAAVVRAYIQHHFDKKENLTKLFYIGPMFRGERPQKGRLRQFHQIGAEVIGPQSASPYLDAEVIALSVNVLKSIGLRNFQVKLNTLGTSEDKKEFSKRLREKFQSRLNELCEDCRDRFERNVFRILDCKNKACQDVVREFHFGYEHLDQESREYFKQLKETLTAMEVPFVESPYLVRGLDYYTHTVFEICDSSLGSQDALGAGGRYNNLVSQLGGPQVDAVGFALGMERILLAKPQGDTVAASGVDVFVIPLDAAAFQSAFLLLSQIRGQGISADIGYQGGSLKSQMRIANKKNAQHVIILGENEIQSKTITIKKMSTGEQSTLKWDASGIAQFLSRHP